MASSSVDLLEEIRAALDSLETRLVGRTVDIEMSRLRVLADPIVVRRLLAERIAYALASSEPSASITVRVARTSKVARIEVFSEGDDVAGDDVAGSDAPDLAAAREALGAMGGEIGMTGPGEMVCWITLPLAAGTSSVADA